MRRSEKNIPMHPMIAQSLKDLDRCVGPSGSTNSWEHLYSEFSPRMRLNFSNTTMDESQIESVTPNPKKRKTNDAASQLNKHRESVTGLDVCRILRNKDTELVDARAAITQLKARLSSLNSSHNKLQLESDTELSQHRLKTLQLTERVDELQLKLKQKCDSVELIQKDNLRIHEEKKAVEKACNNKIEKMAEYVSVADKLKNEFSSCREQLATTEKKLDDKLHELDLAESETSDLRAQSSGHLKEFASLRQQLLQLETLKRQISSLDALNKELEGRLLSLSSQEELATTFEASITKLPDLERQIRILREEKDMYKACLANTRLLEEQAATAQDQLKLMQDRCSHVTRLQASLDHLQDQYSSLTRALREELSLHAVPQPEEVRSLIKGLRATDKGITDNIKAMRDSVSSHEKQTASLEAECRQLRESGSQQQQVSQRQVHLARRLQRKLILVSKERDSLKAILSSYEAETTMTAAAAASTNRLNSLEADLLLYKQEIGRLEDELDQYQQTPSLPGDKSVLSRSDRAELSALKVELIEVKDEVTKLQQEKEVLEYRLEQRALRGDYDPSQVNVLHMKQNPTSEATESYKDDVTRLEVEVKSLKEQLAALAASGNTDAGAKDAAAIEVSSAEMEKYKAKCQELEKEAKSFEVKEKRLLEAVKGQSQEFRSIVYRLTGYEFKVVYENRYELRHLYAESPDDFFTFELTSTGELQLLASDFSNSLGDLIDEYLSQQSSYPAFLAAVTIDLFSKQTMVRPPDDSRMQSSRSIHRASTSGMSRSISAVVARKQQLDEDLAIPGPSSGIRHHHHHPRHYKHHMQEDDDEEEEEEEDDEEYETRGRREPGEVVYSEENSSDDDSDGVGDMTAAVAAVDDEPEEDLEGEEDVAMDDDDEEEDSEEEEEEEEEEDDDSSDGERGDGSGEDNNDGGGGDMMGVDENNGRAAPVPDDDDDEDDLICLD